MSFKTSMKLATC